LLIQDTIRESISDERLPQMETLLNASLMRAVFERELPAACRIEDCAIVSTKYRPGKNILIAYQLKIIDLVLGQSRNQLMTLLACGIGDAKDFFTNAIAKPTFHIPELEAMVWVFPNDRKLAGLAGLIDSVSLSRRYLPEVVAGHFGSEWRIVDLVSDPIRYRPERVYTVRVNLSLRNVRTGDIESLVLFGKTYCLDEGEAAWRWLQLLWNSEARREGRILTSIPLAYQAEIKTIWMCGLEGMTLNEYDVGSEGFYELLALTGSTVAELHRTFISAVPLVTMSEIVSKLEAAADLISRLRPARREELQSLIETLSALSDRIEVSFIATLHGDLHLKNLFVTSDRIARIALLDLDNLSQGDPLRDLGSFIASLHYRGLIEGWADEVVADISRRFILSYRQNADWEVSAASLNWYIAAALISERAYRCLTKLKVEKVEILDEIIDLANKFAARI
jgi:phosphotransferase family enzyme